MCDGDKGGAAREGGAPQFGRGQRKRGGWRQDDRYAAIDLGTNNCRLLVAAPRGKDLRIIDAFSKIVRLGEGLAHSGQLREDAMERAIKALHVCQQKIVRRRVTHLRCIATQACRAAENGDAFLERVKDATGLDFEIISTEEEARLAVLGCADLVDPQSDAGLIFDIGGGSTEISWVRPSENGKKAEIAAWTSLPIGVVNLAERWGGRDLAAADYENLIEHVRSEIAKFGDPAGLRKIFENGDGHLLGTSGTVTSIAGVHLALPKYRRDRVDGLWLAAHEVLAVSQKLRIMSYDERAVEPCVGQERADLVVCGCAILEALLREWPAGRVRVADRGLREGVLTGLAERARRERKKRKGRGKQAT